MVLSTGFALFRGQKNEKKMKKGRFFILAVFSIADFFLKCEFYGEKTS
jgi:hypothetical protein